MKGSVINKTNSELAVSPCTLAQGVCEKLRSSHVVGLLSEYDYIF